MPVRLSNFDDDLRRVQRLLRRERARLAQVRMRAAAGTHDAAEVEAVLAHIEALEELAAAVKARIALTPASAPPAPFRREDHSVLVVDDHEATRYGISRALRASGYQTIEASAGAAALELSPYAAALVLDVQLPDLHGFEVCRLVRSRPATASLPILHVSAVHRSYADREASRTVGADDFMTAPVDFTLLAQRLDGLLHARAAHA